MFRTKIWEGFLYIPLYLLEGKLVSGSIQRAWLSSEGLACFRRTCSRNAPILREDNLPRVSQLVNWTVTGFEFWLFSARDGALDCLIILALRSLSFIGFVLPLLLCSHPTPSLCLQMSIFQLHFGSDL